MSNPHDKATVTVRMRWHGRDVTKEIIIPEHMADCLNPLPKDHDFPGMLDARRANDRVDAFKQLKERRRLAEVISSELTHAIMQEVKSQDPVNGYTPAENREFHSPPEEAAS